MGVGGLLQWMKQQFPESFKEGYVREPAAYLLLDANSLVHDGVRQSATEEAAIANVIQKLERIVLTHRPTNTVIIALDGPAPFAKLETQRHRRLSKAGTKVAIVLPARTLPDDLSKKKGNRVRTHLCTNNTFLSPLFYHRASLAPCALCSPTHSCHQTD